MKAYTLTNYDGVTVVEIEKSELGKIDFESCAHPRETLESFYTRQTTKPEIVINGGLFNYTDGTPCFNYIDDGETIHYEAWCQEGIGTKKDGSLVFGNVDDGGWNDYITGYPVLVKNGVATTITYASEINYISRRSMIGYNDTTIFIVAVEGAGMQFPAMQGLMLKIGCKYAVNLDGGGSTKILYNGVASTQDDTDRAVDNVIAVYLKKYWKVQVGAYSHREGAETMKAKLAAAGFSGFIVLSGSLYRVQVGAFSLKTGAETTATKLKTAGFSTYLVYC